MTRREIQRLAQCLHATGPYYQLAFRDQPARLQSSTVAQRVDLACADPAFGWHVAESYARAALALPDAPWPSAVQRAHAALRDPNCYDVSVRMVEQLNQPEKKTRRDLLRPLLVCADNSLEQLADLCRVSLDVIIVNGYGSTDVRSVARSGAHVQPIMTSNGDEPFNSGSIPTPVAAHPRRSPLTLAGSGRHETILATHSFFNHSVADAG